MNESHLLRLQIDCPNCDMALNFEVPAEGYAHINVPCPRCGTALIPSDTMPHSGHLSRQLADYAGKMGETEEAVDMLESALILDSSCDLAHYLIGVIYDKAKDYERAVRHLAAAIDYNPTSSRYYYAMGVSYLFRNQYESARHYFEQTLAILPIDMAALMNLMACYGAQGDVMGVYLVADRIQVLGGAGPEAQKAANYLSGVLDSLPRRHPLRDALAMIFRAFQLHSTLDGMAQAAEIFKHLVDVLPDDLPAKAILLEYLAGCATALNDHAASYRYSQQARRLMPCAAALAAQPTIHIIEAGMTKDSDRFYKEIVARVFDVEPVMVAYTSGMGGVTGKVPVREAMVSTDDGMFTVHRSGNIIRIRSKQTGELRETHVYEDTYIPLDNLY